MPTLRNTERQDRIARILVDAVISGDDQLTADKYGVSCQSIRRWRKRVTDEDGREALALSTCVQEKLAVLNVDWGTAANAAIVSGLQFLARAAREIAVDAGSVRAIAGAVKLVGELTVLNRTVEAKLAKPAPVTPLRPATEPIAKTG